tara:strand:+ start:2955 stop:3353 length:399 start_codon:yes stop_codon:yes gene_type:complete
MIVGIKEILSGSADVVAIVSNRISPDVRNRGDVFPALTYQVTSTQSTEWSTGSSSPRFASASVDAIARTRLDAEILGDKVVAAFEDAGAYPTSDCIITGRVDSRSASEFYERGGDNEMVYITTIEATLTEVN